MSKTEDDSSSNKQTKIKNNQKKTWTSHLPVPIEKMVTTQAFYRAQNVCVWVRKKSGGGG